MKVAIKIFILFLVVGGIFQQAGAQWLSDSSADLHTRRGVDYIYSLQFDSARDEFNSLIKIQPDHPAGYFFLAMVEWWRILLELQNKENDNFYYSLLEKVIVICDKRLEKNPDDITALFFKGGAIGFRGRLRVHREEWLQAANDGRLAIPIVHQAYRIDPNNIDILLGMGIYNYYRDVIPDEYPFVKPLVIFFPSGDRLLGLQQLQKVSDRARYANVEATYFLIQILSNYENKPNQALPLAITLFKKFPNNPIFHKYLGKLYVSLNKWEDANKIFSDIVVRSMAGQFGYNRSILREAYFYLGIYNMNCDRKDSALQSFYKCDELSRSLDIGEQSGFMVNSNLRIGMIYDIQKKRDLAIKQYNKVLNMTLYQNSQELARQYLKKPYGQF
jgi:tetratricopeptide (TPR) repeat protein